MLCPSCESEVLRFTPDGLAASCRRCARIYGQTALLAALETALGLRHARLVSDRKSPVTG